MENLIKKLYESENILNQQLKKFLDREISEIKEHKNRLIVLAAASVIAAGVFILNGTDEEKAAGVSEKEKPISVEKASKNRTEKKSEPKFTSIKGLEKAAAEVDVINPFKVDIAKSQESVDKKAESKSDIKPAEVNPVPAISVVTPVNTKESNKSIEPKEKVVLILKGTAISGDKKMAIIQRNNNNSSKSKPSNNENDKANKTDKSKVENFILNVGDKIDDRQIINIDKNSVTFDDGQKLYLQEELKL